MPWTREAKLETELVSTNDRDIFEASLNARLMALRMGGCAVQEINYQVSVASDDEYTRHSALIVYLAP